MRDTPISAASDLSPMGALLLSSATPLKDAVGRFAADPSLHGIFLTDQDGRLDGVINNKDLLDWARLQFDLFSRDFTMPVGKVRRLLNANTIGDLALEGSNKLSVRMSDSVSDALVLMAKYELEDIAVVDDDGRIINDLRLSEVLLVALRLKDREDR